MEYLINIFTQIYKENAYKEFKKYHDVRNIDILKTYKHFGLDNWQKLSYIFQEAKKYPFQLEGQGKDVADFLNQNRNPNTTLVLPDTHFPFVKEGFFEWIEKLDKEYQFGTIIHIGDVFDAHKSSFHTSEIEAMNANEEALNAQKDIQRLRKMFPLMFVTIGNHDAIPKRKQKEMGLSDMWVREYSEATKTYGWVWAMDFIIQNTYFCHGLGGKSDRNLKALYSGLSVVQGHHHTESFLKYNGKLNGEYSFSAQIGAAMDEDAYAARYGKANVKKRRNLLFSDKR